MKTFYHKYQEFMTEESSGLENTRSGVGWGRSRGLVKEENEHQETGKDLLLLKTESCRWWN